MQDYEEQVSTVRWINTEKKRYYSVRLEQDLLGDWILVTCWGGLGSWLGGMRIKPVDSAEAGVLEIKRIGKRRRQHGYDAVPQST